MPSRIRWADALTAGVLTAAGLAECWWNADLWAAHGAVAGLLVLTTAPLAWRREAPVAVLLVVAAAFTFPTFIEPFENLSVVVAFLVAIYTVVVWSRAWAKATAVAWVAGAIHGYGTYGHDLGSALASTIWVGFAVGVGVVVRRHQERSFSSEGRASRAEAAREQHAREAVAVERARIARELHDVVAHAIGVIVLQARGGRRMLDVDHAEASAAFDTVEEVAEQALVEMRRMLGVLREDESMPDYALRPSLRDLDALVGQLPGVDVRVDVSGDPSQLPPSLDLTAYRIIQEALTNVLKHAAATSVQLRLTVGLSTLDLEVLDNGVCPAPISMDGYGLAGMRERVAVFGGSLEAGRRPEGGFAVRAQLPLFGSPS